MDAASITKDLQGRRQKAKEGSAKGTKIPQMKIEQADVEKALGTLSGVTDDYLNQHGFLTNVYLNAAKRSGTNVDKYREGLFVAFV